MQVLAEIYLSNKTYNFSVLSVFSMTSKKRKAEANWWDDVDTFGKDEEWYTLTVKPKKLLSSTTAFNAGLWGAAGAIGGATLSYATGGIIPSGPATGIGVAGGVGAYGLELWNNYSIAEAAGNVVKGLVGDIGNSIADTLGEELKKPLNQLEQKVAEGVGEVNKIIGNVDQSMTLEGAKGVWSGVEGFVNGNKNKDGPNVHLGVGPTTQASSQVAPVTNLGPKIIKYDAGDQRVKNLLGEALNRRFGVKPKPPAQRGGGKVYIL
jgi:hypothetical protein